MIGLAVLQNLLYLYGFYMTADERSLLVYLYMPKGSVVDRLRGLSYFARSNSTISSFGQIIHSDVKAANILLDEGFEAVFGDFGLAKLLDLRASHVTTVMQGTIGHIAPEYLSTGKSSDKTDVFGFGILLLELITGKRHYALGMVRFRRD
ncbi:unnamed protein product [Dovyalis caffra]|uniref:non-specific serine/threonine protein kinase n=1 Tax=Dovyalis caffra TaxID=77055 RepID=A0AAV1R163_9ROSI|nr:unnamed protein product [Dovyalis caffra]